MDKIILGGGCFWGIEEYFRKINGIIKTQVGYSGGDTQNPSYEDVCTGNTGHAEVVLIDYNELKISYLDLLNHFWECHDPTQINRQGLDIGTQYRSVIFYFSENQKNLAKESKLELQKKNPQKKIATEITKAKDFYLAEDYHQCFLQKKKI
tara:strand:+ start:211 stop:663 length:453 start_codon:yes stop_codon:yes gene_type:complete